MRLQPNSLSSQLCKNLSPIYVVGGEEPLLIEESLDAIRAAARKEGYTEREVLEVEAGFDWNRLVESYMSLSLFASRRIIELRMPRGIAPGRRKTADDESTEGEAGEKTSGASGVKVLPELARNPAPDTILLVICGKLEHRTRSSGWFSALEQAGASLYAESVNSEQLPGWLEGRLKKAGLVADAEAIELLAERTEGHLLAAAQDIEKLKLLFPDGRIGLEQIVIAVADSARFEVFDLADKILSGDTAGAARALGRLRDEGEEIPKLLGALAYDLRCWAAAALAYEKGGDPGAACEHAHVRRARQPYFIKGLQRTRATQVFGWLADCARIDAAFKRGDKELAWEELLTCVVAASGLPRVAVPPAA